jgi:uncharacterized protein (DUF1501 family)
MLNRRDFLAQSLKASTLLAVGRAVPGFLANTARAAEHGKETVLVVVELSGGNDGMNTVIPYADDLYHKARPTLRLGKKDVLAVNEHIGLHTALMNLQPLRDSGSLAIVQGVGYPNPDRSHFESMDIWQSADPARQTGTGWLGRSVPALHDEKGNVPALQVGAERLPLALQGAPGGVVSLNQRVPYQLNLGDTEARKQPRRKLLEDLAKPAGDAQPGNDLLDFVRRRQVQTYATIDRLKEVLDAYTKEENRNNAPNGLTGKMDLIARLINQGFGTRIFYVSLDGFDTHARQAEAHADLLRELGQAVGQLFAKLKEGKHDERVVLMTFSEFGRRVKENGSRGTDHGAGSCLFVAGPGVAGGPIGTHPKLDDLDNGDLKHAIDFRRVYATILDQWLGCDSQTVLGGKFEHLPLFKKANPS